MQIKSPQITDSEEISKLIKTSISGLNKVDYTNDEINAWRKLISQKHIKKVLKDPTHRNFIATNSNEIIGFVSISTNEALLRSLYIKPENSKQGIGSELLKLAENFLKSRGKSQIKLNSSKTAKTFYEKKGFTQENEIDLLIEGLKIPVTQMTKNLSSK